MAAKASLFAASCVSLTCVAVLHSTDKSARRNSWPVSKGSHEKARNAAELTYGGVGQRGNMWGTRLLYSRLHLE